MQAMECTVLFSGISVSSLIKTSCAVFYGAHLLSKLSKAETGGLPQVVGQFGLHIASTHTPTPIITRSTIWPWRNEAKQSLTLEC